MRPPVPAPAPVLRRNRWPRHIWLVPLAMAFCLVATAQEAPRPALPAIAWELIPPAQQYTRLLSIPSLRRAIGVEEIPTELLEELGSKGDVARKAGPPPKEADRDPPEQTDESSSRQVEERVEERIGKDAARRLAELRYQSLGLRFALRADPALAPELKVSEEQRTRIDALPIGGLPPRLGGADSKEVQEKELAILDAAQREKWVARRGPHYEDRLPLLLAVQSQPQRLRVPPYLSGASYAALLVDPAVQEHLGLSAGDRTRADRLAGELKEGDRELASQHPAEVAATELVKMAEERRTAVRESIAKALSKPVEQRLSEILRQNQGLLPGLRSDPEIARGIALTPQQLQEIAMLFQSGTLPRPPRPTDDPGDLQGQFREYRRRVDDILAEEVLTEEQRATWREMTGEPAELQVFVLPFLPNLPPGIVQASR